MNQIARCDWLPERARWSDLARSGLPAASRKQNFTKSHIINPLLTKFVRSRWLDIGLVLFCEFMDLDFVSVHKHAKKELGQYPAILTSHLVNNPYIKSVSEKKSGSHRTSYMQIVKSKQSYSNGHLPCHCSIQYLARARCMTWHVNLRGKDAQKQLARTSLKCMVQVFWQHQLMLINLRISPM